MDVSDIFQTILGKTFYSVIKDNSMTLSIRPQINTVGGVKTNVAIMSKEEEFLKDLLKVPDDRGLTQWSDKDTMWERYKSECFLTPPDNLWKYNGTDILSDRIVTKGRKDLTHVVKEEVGGTTKNNSFVSSFCPQSGASGEVLTEGERYNRVVSKMADFYRLASLLEVDGRISCNARVPIVFRKSQVCLKTAEMLGVKYELEGEFVILYLKALIDTGSCDNLIGEDNIGKIIKDKGIHTSVSSILDDSRSYAARQVEGYLKTGKASLTIVKELSKSENSFLLMAMLRNVMAIPKDMYEACNLDDIFLESPVQIVIGVLDAQSAPVDMGKLGFRNVHLNPRLQLLETRVGLGWSFQGCLGALTDDFLCPILRFRREVCDVSYHEEGDPCPEVKEIPETALVHKLIHHLLARHYTSIKFTRFAHIIEEQASEKKMVIEEYDLCKQPSIPGKEFYVFGWKFPGKRCSTVEDILTELHTRGVSFVTI